MSKIMFVFSVATWGTIGLFVRYIPLPSPLTAFLRALIASVFLSVCFIVTKRKINFSNLKKHVLKLIISGACIGFNWIFLFEAYKYTSISSATVSYYFAPVIVLFVSPFLFKEKLSKKTIACIILAVIGLMLVNATDSSVAVNNTKGIVYCLIAATLYATATLLNKTLTDIPSFDRTLLQLSLAAIIVLPYVVITTGFDMSAMNTTAFISLAVLGVFHTGIAYFMYFHSLGKLKSKDIAILSYMDPATAILVSVFLLQEPIATIQLIGCGLILASSLISELPTKSQN